MDPAPLPSADELLDEYLVLLEKGAIDGFESYLERHPGRAEELRQAWREWRRGLSVLERGGAGELDAVGRSFQAGSVLGDFRLLRHLGTGGQGSVWEAHQLSLDRIVALKLVRPERLSSRALDLFQREARAGSRSSHPGIVAVHGHGEDDGVAWIAMERVEDGRTLRDLVDAAARLDAVPPEHDRRAARIVAEIAEAVHHAHEAGVIHRDLKPQNVLLTRDDLPKVTDFGLARITDATALSEAGQVTGTYAYMSPEQVSARAGEIDARTDVFSLGVVLYELLTLERPFRGDTTQQIAMQILMVDPPEPRTLRSRIPRDLAVIAAKALEKDRRRRYPTMAALAADLRRFLRDEPILARPATRWQRAVKWSKRHPAGSLAALVAAVAFVAISLLLAENVRARGEVERKVTELDLTNRELDARNEELARTVAEWNAEIESVRRLSDLQDLEDLVAEADDLRRMWPAHPERIQEYLAWLGRARELSGRLDVHRRTRAALRAKALPRTEEERLRERRSHPRFRELDSLEGELAWARRVLAQRRSGTECELPDVSGPRYPDDPQRLLSAAAPLVAPEREEHGQEPLALALARRALELAGEEDDLLAEIHSCVAAACFALGRDDEAIDAAFEALEAAPPEERGRFRRALQQLEAEVAAAQEEEALAELERRVAALEDERERLDAVVDERRDWHFGEENAKSRWWDSQLTKLIDGLEALADEETGLLGEEAISPVHGWSVPLRLARARELDAAFAPGGEYDLRWQRALSDIAAAYPGLDLGIQMGLVPIGADPHSGRFEFWHVQSGAEPPRGADGRLRIGDESGVVLVLLPGGTFLMGAQADAPHGSNHDAEAHAHDGPVHEVELSPFFLAKHEMTQRQWERVTGANPSRFHPGLELAGLTLRNPVETVDWHQARTVLERLGLALPTEAQWEYGCRAGTSTPFSHPRGQLAACANLADELHASVFPGSGSTEEWSDGFPGPAPVGSLEPNAWGLHDLHGNVWEWCLDGFDAGFYARISDPDPLAPFEGAAFRVARGGGFDYPAVRARAAARSGFTSTFTDATLGLRPARAVERRDPPRASQAAESR